MIKKIVRYQAKADQVDAVRAAILEFVAAISQHEPDTIYGALVGDDGRTFVHAMAFADETTEETHRSAPYTKRFVEVLYPKCDHEPEFTTFQVVATTKRGGGFLGLDHTG